MEKELSKEEILYKKFKEVAFENKTPLDEFLKLCTPDFVPLEEDDKDAQSVVLQTLSAMTDFADQQSKKEAIAFKDWCDSGQVWFNDILIQHNHSNEELYQLYSSQK